jgi:hypothetical protein
MNRAAFHQTYFFKDCSVMAELSLQVSKPLKVYAKATYDVNRTNTDRDQLVMAGTEMKMAGIGAEYHALKATKQDIRVHAYYFYSWGTNSNPSGTLLNKMSVVDLGVKWRVNFLSAKKK